LRFFAFLGVYQFHSYVGAGAVLRGPHWIAIVNRLNYAGLYGVDLFFTLSAYLITELLLREKRQFATLDVRAFYLRRILRIWPLYFFVIGLGLIPFFDPQHTFTGRYVISFLLLAGNWSVVAWGWTHSSFDVLWTVSIEEQFYLLWPPIVRRLSANHLACVAIAMLVLASATRAAMVAIHAGRFSIWCNTLARLDPIALGILIAVLLRGRVPNFRIWTRLTMLLGGTVPVVLVANSWNLPSPQRLEWIPSLLGFPIVAVCCTLILLASLGISSHLPRALVYLGKISYGLYVYHVLAEFLTDHFLYLGRGHFRWLLLKRVVGLAVTILLASLSYAVLERPFLNLKKRFELIGSRPI